MKIYTKSGDAGETGLCNGERVSKADLRIHLCGSLDELNCKIGEIIAGNNDDEIEPMLRHIQRDLFNVGAILAEANIEIQFDVSILEKAIDIMDSQLPPLRDFILPSGPIHSAREIIRRIERDILKVSASKDVITPILQYMNRLSDLLFVLARYTNMKHGQTDVRWH